jgi:hypothetical protein
MDSSLTLRIDHLKIMEVDDHVQEAVDEICPPLPLLLLLAQDVGCRVARVPAHLHDFPARDVRHNRLRSIGHQLLIKK